jgi:SAM-dependent methyltransferase
MPQMARDQDDSSSVSTGYFDTRLAADPRRDVLWRTLGDHFFSRIIRPSDTVLDLGAGHATFVNHVHARRRIAVDTWPGLKDAAAPGVEVHIGDIANLDFLEDRSIDFAFASNVFEHITQPEFAKVLATLARKLTPTGTLNIIQPNFKYCAKDYFDDFTHVAIYSHVSLSDFIAAQGYEVFDCRGRFLPLTVKSRLPVHPLLIRAYLLSPIKPMAGQLFLRARLRTS